MIILRMVRPAASKSGYHQYSPSFQLESRSSRSPCRGYRRYSRCSSTSSCSSSDSYSNRRYKRFDKFRNESHTIWDRRCQTKENYPSVKKNFRYKCEDAKTRHRNVHKNKVKSKRHGSPEPAAGQYQSRYPRCYKSDEFNSVKHSARGPDVERKPKSYDGDVKDHVTAWSIGREASLVDSTSDDDVILKGWGHGSRSRSTSRSSSGQYRRFDKFSRDERREERNVGDRETNTCRRYNYTEVRREKSEQSRNALSDRVENSGVGVKRDEMVEEKPFSDSSRFRESRKQKKKRRKSKKQEFTKTSKFCQDYKDDGVDYDKTRPHIQVNDFNLSFNSRATPAILNINLNNSVSCGTRDWRCATETHVSSNYDDRQSLHKSRRRRHLEKTSQDYTDSRGSCKNRRGADSERMSRHS